MYRLSLAALLALTACNPEKAAPADPAQPSSAPRAPASEEEKTLYALGLSIGSSIEVFKLTTTELDFVLAGVRDQVTGATPLCDLAVYGPKLEPLARSRQGGGAGASGEEEQKGKEFAAAAAAAPGAQTLPSGLVITITEPGTGASPTAADTVKVNYTGSLRDGTVFDASANHGGAATFPLGGVIPCWTEGVAKLKVGGKATLICPPDIAYGADGSPPVIPGGATLKFDVELLEIVSG